MDFKLILEGKATLEDLYKLNGFGYEFVLEGERLQRFNSMAVIYTLDDK